MNICQTVKHVGSNRKDFNLCYLRLKYLVHSFTNDLCISSIVIYKVLYIYKIDVLHV